MEKSIFIQLVQANKKEVRYFCVGFHDKDNKFTGLVHGFEGGGEFSEKLIIQDKFIPDYLNDEPIEWDTLVDAFNRISLYTFDELDEAIREYLDFDTSKQEWEVVEDKMNIFDGKVYSKNMLINPPSYAMTTWDDRDIGYWTMEEFIQILKVNSKDALYEYVEDYIENHKAFPVDCIINMDEDFEFKIEFAEYENILGKEIFEKLTYTSM